MHVEVGQRGEPGRVVGEQFGRRAPEAEHHEGPEDLVLDDPGEQFGAALGERLDDHCGHPVPEPGDEIAVGGPDLGGVLKVEVEGVLLALVQQTGPVRLHDDPSVRSGEPVGRGDGLVLVPGPGPGDLRDAVAAQEHGRRLRIEPPPVRVVVQEGGGQVPRVAGPDVRQLRHRAGQSGEPVGAGGGVGQGAGGVLGVGVRGQGAPAGGRQQLDAGGLRGQHRDDRARERGGGRGRGAHQVLAGGRGDRRGDEAHQDGIDGAVPGQKAYARPQLLLADGCRDVHGVACRGAVGQQRAEVVHQVGCEPRDDESGVHARVGGQNAGAARVADDGDLRAVGQRLGVQEGGGAEEFTDGAGGGDAGLGEQGLPGHGRGGRGRGVRGRGPPSSLGPAGVHGQYRHRAGHPAGGAGEGAGVAEGLQMQQRQLGVPVALPPLEHVVAADVVLVAERDEGRHPDAEPGQAVQQRDADASGLHGDTGGTGPGVPVGKGGVQVDAGVGVGQAQAVRADEPHAVAPACVHQGGAPVGVEAGGHHDQGAHTGSPALLGHLGTAITARSGTCGRSATDRQACTPAIESASGCTAYNRAVQEPLWMFRRIARPTDPGVRPAPITATVPGRSKGRRLAMPASRPRDSTALK